MSKETRDAADERPSYKDTLNLLQTGFGMRANAIKREPELQSFWNDNGIVNSVPKVKGIITPKSPTVPGGPGGFTQDKL